MEVYYKGIKSNRKPQKGYILSESLSSLKITRLFLAKDASGALIGLLLALRKKLK